MCLKCTFLAWWQNDPSWPLAHWSFGAIEYSNFEWRKEFLYQRKFRLRDLFRTILVSVWLCVIASILAVSKLIAFAGFIGYIDIGDGCYRQNVLLKHKQACWWQFWKFRSSKSKFCYQYPKIVTILSQLHHCHRMMLHHWCTMYPTLVVTPLRLLLTFL